MIRTRISQMFGLQYPVMSAPMGGHHSGGRLAAAISQAGGLGLFGALTPYAGPDWVREQVLYIRSQTDKPFGVGFINALIPLLQGHFDAAVDGKPPVVTFSFGTAKPYIDQAKAAGATVICQVQSLHHARDAVAAGADALVAQGNEAGGHTGYMNLIPLLCRVVDEYPDLPVMAAGGIASGRALAAVLAAGADGAWLGTAFLATPECTELPDNFKELIVQSDGEDTVFTRVYDVLSGLPWPEDIGERVRRNRVTDEWHGREEELRNRRAELAPQLAPPRDQFDPDRSEVLYGQSSGFVTAVRPAAEVLRTICEDAERLLRERPRNLLSS